MTVYSGRGMICESEEDDGVVGGEAGESCVERPVGIGGVQGGQKPCLIGIVWSELDRGAAKQSSSQVKSMSRVGIQVEVERCGDTDEGRHRGMDEMDGRSG